LAVDEPVADLSPCASPSGRRGAGHTQLSQSERDWAYAKRALGRGEPEGRVTEEIARYRVGQKHDPHDYARRTVRKAVSQREQVSDRQAGPEEEKQR